MEECVEMRVDGMRDVGMEAEFSGRSFPSSNIVSVERVLFIESTKIERPMNGIAVSLWTYSLPWGYVEVCWSISGVLELWWSETGAQTSLVMCIGVVSRKGNICSF